jgi:hypothetical protein
VSIADSPGPTFVALTHAAGRFSSNLCEEHRVPPACGGFEENSGSTEESLQAYENVAGLAHSGE